MYELISVIVPVYNVERYIDKCIQSILKQSYESFELILVDDGSTDNSGMICDCYQKQDNRISVIHQRNKGLSEARNSGIRKSKGLFITFIDSDDYVDYNYLLYLYQILKSNEADISICLSENVYPTDKTKTHVFGADCTKKLSTLEALKALLYRTHKFTNSAWGKLYRKNLFNSVEFPIGQLHEDVGTIYKLFAKAKSVVCGYECLYYYMQRDNSIIHSAFNPDRFDYITHTINIIQYMEENFPELINAAVFMHFRACIQLYLSIPKTVEYKPYRKKIEHEINKYRRLVLDDQEARVSFRIIAAVTYLGHGWLYLLTPFK